MTKRKNHRWYERSLAEVVLTLIFLAAVTSLVYVGFQVGHQINVLIYKAAVVLGGAVLGYLFDQAAFLRGGQLKDQRSEVTRAAVILRRGVMVIGGSIAMSLAV